MQRELGGQVREEVPLEEGCDGLRDEEEVGGREGVEESVEGLSSCCLVFLGDEVHVRSCCESCHKSIVTSGRLPGDVLQF